MKKVKAKTVVGLIIEGALINCKNVEVTFYPAYDEELHKTLSPSLIESLKNEKVSTFNIFVEALDIIYLTKNKDVKSMKWID